MSLRFANLGPTPGDHSVTVLGNLYVLIVDGVAIIFDPRRYLINPPSDEYRVTFNRVGDAEQGFEIAVLPPSILERTVAAFESFRRPFAATLDEVREVYVVNLSGEPPATIGWRQLVWLFPDVLESRIRNIPIGRTNWSPAAEEERERNILRAVEETKRVERGEKVTVGALSLFLFEGKNESGLSALVSGETGGRRFAFFFGEKSLEEFFPRDRVGVDSSGVRTLAGGSWYAFYPASSCSSELQEDCPRSEDRCGRACQGAGRQT